MEFGGPFVRPCPAGTPQVRRLLLIVGAAVLVAASCTVADPEVAPFEATVVPTEQPVDADRPTPTPAQPDPATPTPEDPGVGIEGSYRLDVAGCAFDLPEDVDTACYDLVVPERWEVPEGPMVSLHVGVFGPDRDDAHTLVYLEGGPGGDPLEGVGIGWSSFWADLAAEQQLVLFAQRGTGDSEPSLQCPEIIEADLESLTETDPDVEEAAAIRAWEGCTARLRDEGVDLGAYNSVQSAHDVDALRAALGHDQWNVLGVSYGTRLGQTLLREHPDGVRAIILDAVYPTTASEAGVPASAKRAFDEVFAACVSDASCENTYGDLEGRFRTLVDRLDEEPLAFQASDLETFQTYEVVLGGDDLVSIVFQMIYTRAFIADVPLLIDSLEAGETDWIAGVASRILSQQDSISWGMNRAVECHEELALTSAEEITAGLTGDPLYDDVFGDAEAGQAVCAIFDAGAADPVEDEPVESAVPALVMSGQFDPITPPAYGAEVSSYLSNGTHVVLSGNGHGALGDDCGRTLMLAFLAEPQEVLDQSCLEDVGPFAWEVDRLVAPARDVEVSVVLGADLIVPMPENWKPGPLGLYVEDSGSVLRQGVIVFQTLPGLGIDAAPALLFGQIGIEASGEPEEVDFGDVTWVRSVGELPGVAVVIYAADIDGIVVLAIVQASRGDIERLEGGPIATMLAGLRTG